MKPKKTVYSQKKGKVLRKREEKRVSKLSKLKGKRGKLIIASLIITLFLISIPASYNIILSNNYETYQTQTLYNYFKVTSFTNKITTNNLSAENLLMCSFSEKYTNIQLKDAEFELSRNPLKSNLLPVVIEYISNKYPYEENIEFLDVFEDINSELNLEVTVFKVQVGDRKTYFTVNDTTLEVQEDKNVLSRIYENYLTSLPYPYQKMSPELRMEIREKYYDALPLNPSTIYEFPVIFFVDSSQNLNLLETEVSKFTSNYTKYDGMTVKFISAQLPLNSILAIGNLTLVSGMWLNNKVESDFSTEIDYSVPYLNGDDVHNIGIDGLYSCVGVIDTGIDSNHPALPWVYAVEDFTDAWWDTYSWNPDDTNGHGTHVAGIIGSNDAYYTGMAPGTWLISAKVLEGGGNSGTTSTYIAGVDWALQQGENLGLHTIIQTSWGSQR